jgi:hypothetical protein
MKHTPEGLLNGDNPFDVAVDLLNLAEEEHAKNYPVIISEHHALYLILNRRDDPSLKMMLQEPSQREWRQGITLFREEKRFDDYGNVVVDTQTYFLTPDGKAYALKYAQIPETMRNVLTSELLQPEQIDIMRDQLADSRFMPYYTIV